MFCPSTAAAGSTRGWCIKTRDGLNARSPWPVARTRPPSVAGGRRVVQETVIAPTRILYVKGTVMTTPSGRWLTGTQDDPVMVETDQPTDRRRRGMGRAALQVVIGVGLLVWAYFLAT